MCNHSNESLASLNDSSTHSRHHPKPREREREREIDVYLFQNGGAISVALAQQINLIGDEIHIPAEDVVSTHPLFAFEPCPDESNNQIRRNA